jgi:hypothetical protein
MDNFDLRKYLAKNKATTNSRMLEAEMGSVPIDVLDDNTKYHLVVTVPQDVKGYNPIKAGTYKIELPERIWPGTLNNDSEKLYKYLSKYPSSTKVQLVNSNNEIEEEGKLLWSQDTPKGEIPIVQSN